MKLFFLRCHTKYWFYVRSDRTIGSGTGLKKKKKKREEQKNCITKQRNGHSSGYTITEYSKQNKNEGNKKKKKKNVNSHHNNFKHQTFSSFTHNLFVLPYITCGFLFRYIYIYIYIWFERQSFVYRWKYKQTQYQHHLN